MCMQVETACILGAQCVSMQPLKQPMPCLAWQPVHFDTDTYQIKSTLQATMQAQVPNVLLAAASLMGPWQLHDSCCLDRHNIQISRCQDLLKCSEVIRQTANACVMGTCGGKVGCRLDSHASLH